MPREQPRVLVLHPLSPLASRQCPHEEHAVPCTTLLLPLSSRCQEDGSFAPRVKPAYKERTKPLWAAGMGS